MSLPVNVLGLGAEGVESLSVRARAALERATFVAGGARHLALADVRGVETLAITNNLGELAQRLRNRCAADHCVVLASGDPLFFGIGAYLRAQLGPEALVFEPSVSSMQLAFARARLPWNGAAIGSVHGRPLAANLIPLLGQTRIGLFTEDGTSPAAIADFFLTRGLDDYAVWVCEDLGTDAERMSELDIKALSGRRFRDLNVVIMERPADALTAQRRAQLMVPPDKRFAQPETGPVLLTHADVRAAALSRFYDVPEGPIWDIGAGLGGMTIGLGHLFAEREVVAVERSSVQAAFLKTNRRRFGTWNVRVIEGAAPEALDSEPVPAAVFLGGSGGRLDAILDLATTRMMPAGVLVANFIGLENLARAMERLTGLGWSPQVTQLQISHGDAIAGLTSLAPLRPVWIVRAVRPLD